MTEKDKKETLVRMNSRIRKDQLQFVKAEASRLTKLRKKKVTEGEVFRDMVDFYKNNHKNNE